MKESDISNLIRINAASNGVYLWRNNVGAAFTKTGSFIRFGLGNDSPAVNAMIKSSDLIGVTPVTITQEMVGKTVGVFTCREVKKTGWKYTGTPREKAQRAWIDLINSMGGDAAFVTDEGVVDV